MEKLENNLSTNREDLKKTEENVDKKDQSIQKKLSKVKDSSNKKNANKKDLSNNINLETENKTKKQSTNTESIKKDSSMNNSLKTENTSYDKETATTAKNKQLINIQDGKKKKIIYSAIIIVILLLLLILSTVFGVVVSHSNKITSGVSVCGIDVSKLTQSDALEKLEKELSADLNKKITLTHGDYSTTLDVSLLNPSYDLDASVSDAYSIGRSGGNIFSNNFSVISTFFGKKNITPKINIDSKILDEQIKSINGDLPDGVINSSYEIKDNNLIIKNSSNGYIVKNEELKNAIYSSLTNNISNIEIPVEHYQAEEIDIDAIYNEIHKEPVDASFTTNPLEIHKEEPGLDFGISLDEVKKIISQDQESYSIPLKVLNPKVTVKTLPQEAFPDLLATYSSTYAQSNYNRSTNIALATKSVSGTVLMPGETFSYNETVGQRTPARGYKEAGVYVNGAVSTDYGGGICQVSSTLYNATLLCNLEIVERRNHTFESSYVPAGQDATVSWQSPDFKFKNNRNYPIRLNAVAGSGRVTFSIYGLKSDDDYEVKIQSSKIAIIPFTTEYKDDSSIPVGTTKVIQSGSNGCKSQTYKILYKNGSEVSRSLINSDTYKPHNQVVARGTGAVPTPPTPPTPNQNNGAPVSVPSTTEQETQTQSDSSSGVTVTTNVPQ